MGSSSSKFPFPSSSTKHIVGESDSEHADICIDAMERADWNSTRKPTWHQRFDEFVVNVYDPR